MNMRQVEQNETNYAWLSWHAVSVTAGTALAYPLAHYFDKSHKNITIKSAQEKITDLQQQQNLSGGQEEAYVVIPNKTFKYNNQDVQISQKVKYSQLIDTQNDIIAKQTASMNELDSASILCGFGLAVVVGYLANSLAIGEYGVPALDKVSNKVSHFYGRIGKSLDKMINSQDYNKTENNQHYTL